MDQREGVLPLDPTDGAEKDSFLKGRGPARRRDRLWVLLAMREDYMGGLYRYLRHIPGHLRARYRLDFLTRDEALDAIQKPAAAQGVQISDEAALLLIDKLAYTHVESPGQEIKRLPTPYVEPFQLQVTCRRLWKDARQVRGDHFPAIDESDVERVDIDQALSRYYADCVADVEQRFGGPQRILRDWIETNPITAAQLRTQPMTAPAPRPAGAYL